MLFPFPPRFHATYRQGVIFFPCGVQQDFSLRAVVVFFLVLLETPRSPLSLVPIPQDFFSLKFGSVLSALSDCIRGFPIFLMPGIPEASFFFFPSPMSCFFLQLELPRKNSGRPSSPGDLTDWLTRLISK